VPGSCLGRITSVVTRLVVGKGMHDTVASDRLYCDTRQGGVRAYEKRMCLRSRFASSNNFDPVKKGFQS